MEIPLSRPQTSTEQTKSQLSVNAEAWKLSFAPNEMTDESPEQQNAAPVSTPTTTISVDTNYSAEGAMSLPLAMPPPPTGMFSSGGFSLLCPSVEFSEISFKEV